MKQYFKDKPSVEHLKINNHLANVQLDYINNRIKVTDNIVIDWKEMLVFLDETAIKKELGKILLNIKATHVDETELNDWGYICEGVIPGFFQGETAYCYSKFIDSSRAESLFLKEEQNLLREVLNKKPKDIVVLPEGYILKKVNTKEIEKLVSLYKQIFSTYPSPLLKPSYVLKMMETCSSYYGVFVNGSIVSAASAEMDFNNLNAEITDCATLPDYRGQGLLTCLINALEIEMKGKKIKTLYSLARAGSFGMNSVLYNLGYKFKGTFINNCHIGGRFEDMNLWVKSDYF